MNIHGLVIDTICQRADQYEGQSTIDGLQMTSMKSAMDEDMVTLQKRGYISKAIINISTTQAQQNRPSVLRQHRLRLSVLPRSRGLARGREPRPEPGFVIGIAPSMSWRTAAMVLFRLGLCTTGIHDGRRRGYAGR